MARREARIDFDFELTKFFAVFFGRLFNFFIGLDEIFSAFKERDGGKLKDEGSSDENEDNINKNDEALVEGFGHDGVQPTADEAAVIPDGADAGDPENHKN